MLRRLLILVAVAGIVALMCVPAAAQEPQAQTIELVHIDGLIDPPMRDFLIDVLRSAKFGELQAVVLQIDTEGSVAVDVAPILAAIREAEVPVIAWVAPRGARADGAGREILEESGLVLASPQASLGSAQGLVEEQAASLGDVIRSLDGRKVPFDRRLAFAELETWDESAFAPSVRVRFQDMNVLQTLLHAVTRPEVALALLLIGVFGLIFEIYNPGVGLAAGVGVVALGLGLYALLVLPTDWVGVLLVVVATLMFTYDVHTGGLGAWSVGGVAALVTGTLLMFRDAPEPVRLSLLAVVAAVAGTLIFFISVMTAALRVRLRRPVTADDGIIGTIAEARTDIAPEGTVFSNGRLWRARTMETGIAAGSKVEVKATEGLVLLVEPIHGEDDEG